MNIGIKGWPPRETATQIKLKTVKYVSELVGKRAEAVLDKRGNAIILTEQ